MPDLCVEIDSRTNLGSRACARAQCSFRPNNRDTASSTPYHQPPTPPGIGGDFFLFFLCFLFPFPFFRTIRAYPDQPHACLTISRQAQLRMPAQGNMQNADSGIILAQAYSYVSFADSALPHISGMQGNPPPPPFPPKVIIQVHYYINV